MKKISLFLLALLCSVGMWATDVEQIIAWKWTAASSSWTSGSTKDFTSVEGNKTLSYLVDSTSDKINANAQTNKVNGESVSYSHQLYMNGATSATRTLTFTGISGTGKLVLVTGSTAGGKAVGNTGNSGALILATAATSNNATNITTIATNPVPQKVYKSEEVTLTSTTTYYILCTAKTYFASVVWIPSSLEQQDVNDVTFTPAAGTYNGTQNVTLTADLDGSTIYYTTDGSEPTTSSNVYSSAIAVSADMTIKALVVNDDAQDVTKSAAYTINVSEPIYKLNGYGYTLTTCDIDEEVQVSIEQNDNVPIYYTLDGSTPTTSSTLYTAPFAVSATTTIKAIANNGAKTSSVKSLALTAVDDVVFNFNYTHFGKSLNAEIADGTEFIRTGVTLTYSKGEASTSAQFTEEATGNDIRLRVYNKSSFTLTAPANYLIKKVVFSGNNVTNVYYGSIDDNANKIASNQKDFGESPVASATFNCGTGSTVRLRTLKITLVPASEEITISPAGYATYFNAEHAVTLPEGVEAYVGYFNAGNWNFVKEYDADAVVPANTPVVLKAVAGPYTLAYTTGGTAPANNDLVGAAADMTAAEMEAAHAGTNYFYALSLNAAGETNSVGFYWVEDEGAAFDITAGKAYLVLPQSMFAAPVRSFIFGENPVATGVESATAVKATKALVNGQLIIVRNGVKFNLNGMLVK